MQPYSDMIPFYLNGTLDETEYRQFERALAQNPQLAEEVEAWREIAQGVVDEVRPKTVQLPPISPAIREAVQLRQSGVTDESNEPAFELMPNRGADTPFAPRSRTWQLPLTMAAAVTVMLFVVVLLIAVNRGNSTTDTATQVAVIGTVVTNTPSATELTPASGSGGLGADSTSQAPTEVRATSIMPPTATNQLPPNPPTDVPIGGGGDGNDGPDTLPLPPIGTPDPNVETFAFDTQMQPTNNPSGNCFVVNESAQTLNIHQFADRNTDIIGVMAPGDRYDTWIQTRGAADQSYYQVFLPASSIRLGWVATEQLNLYGPDGSQTCNQLLEPTPTNPAFPSNLPTPFPDSVCRISSATNGAMVVYASPDISSRIIYSYGPGNLVEARGTYQGGWLQVIVSGVGFGWVQADTAILNGLCNLPPISDPVQATEPVPSRTPNTEPALCRASRIGGGQVDVYSLPDWNSGLAANQPTEAESASANLYALRRSDGNWYAISRRESSGQYTELGWANGSEIQLQGNCGDLPYITMQGIVATATPTPTTFVQPSSTPTRESVPVGGG
jgi:hypothetical protein